jgi:hypothetical protein
LLTGGCDCSEDGVSENILEGFIEGLLEGLRDLVGDGESPFEGLADIGSSDASRDWVAEG